MREKEKGEEVDLLPRLASRLMTPRARAVSAGHRHDDLYRQSAEAKCLLGQIYLFSKDAEHLLKFPYLAALFLGCKKKKKKKKTPIGKMH